MEKILIIFLLVCLVCVIEWIREVVTFQITRYQISSPKLSDLKRERRVVVLSDLHNNRYGAENEKLLLAIQREKPDLILVAGDMLIGKSGVPVETAKKFMSELPKICRTYYGNGNHEQRMKEFPDTYGNVYEEYKKELVASGVHFLENERVTEIWDGQEVELCGLEVPIEYYKKWKKMVLPKRVIETCIGQADKSKYEILIAHNPTFVPAYLEWGADLVLSGHFHGGVVRIPFIGGVITPQFHMFPKYSGEHTKVGDASVVVSKGLGMHTMKVRFLNPAEVVVLQIGG